MIKYFNDLKIQTHNVAQQTLFSFEQSDHGLHCLLAAFLTVKSVHHFFFCFFLFDNHI